MKFIGFRKFNLAPTIENVVAYLSGDIASALQTLQSGLAKLTIGENFESFEVDLVIPASSELPIRNEFRGGVIPTKWLKVGGNQYSNDVCNGDTTWTQGFLYLKNTAASSATIKVIFLR